ncbi:MAG: efflux transporter outer membrane subunit [Pseudomonadota bacterium]|nr:efflux transporter outer membrane subunit [Pseudomonadota bacterium]
MSVRLKLIPDPAARGVAVLKRLSVVLAAVLLLGGCMLGNDYRRPRVDAPRTWRCEEKDAQALANTVWWGQFKDPALNELIRTALKESKDVRIATARVEEYLGRLGTTRADFFPQMGLGAAAGRQRLTEVGPTGWNPATPPTSYTLQGSLNVNWELDLWGKLRRATEAARADLLGADEARRAVMMTLVAAVANGYINLLNYDQQLVIARETLKSRKDSLEIFEKRYAGGVISELELNQSRSEYEDARAVIPQLEKNIAQQENALNLLVGRNPGPIPRGRTLDELAMPAVPAGIPSEILDRRPDIRQAEQNLIAANARIAVARALYFPSISLTGVFGFASAELSDLTTGPAKTWNYAASLTAPIFTAGSIKGRIRQAEALQEQALLKYLQTVQTAFKEVDDSLTDQRKYRERLAVQGEQVTALRNTRRLAGLRYENGYSSYLEVLDAERSLFNGQLSLVQTKGNLFQSLVNIYKTMGGGWITEADKMAGGYDADAKPASIPAEEKVAPRE